MKNALIAVAITALMGGLVIAPVTHQSAHAQVYGGLKAAGTTGGSVGDNNLILVGRGGHGGGHGGGRGGHMGGHHGGGHFAHGGGRGHGHGGRAYARNWHGGGGHHANKGHRNYYAHNYNYRYYRHGHYYRNYRWYGGVYAYGYGYGGCAWLRRQALITGSSYWWNRYYACIY